VSYEESGSVMKETWTVRMVRVKVVVYRMRYAMR
jgi:hypothetical protein